MNKLVTLPIDDAVKIKPADDKTVRIAAEVKEAERHARRNGVARNILERNQLSKKAYGALCKLDMAATKLTRTAPITAAGLVAKAGVAKLFDGYSEGFSEEIEKELASDVLRVLAPGTASRIMADLAILQNPRESSPVLQAVSNYRRALRVEAKDSYFVGGVTHNKFIRFKIDQIARTLPGPTIREWWVRTLDQVIAPFVKGKGFDWEISIDETPFDLWSLQGELAPPFESIAEKRWVKDNKASPYTLAEKLPVNLLLAPGVTDQR